jgi:hypothetical protein
MISISFFSFSRVLALATAAIPHIKPLIRPFSRPHIPPCPRASKDIRATQEGKKKRKGPYTTGIPGMMIVHLVRAHVAYMRGPTPPLAAQRCPVHHDSYPKRFSCADWLSSAPPDVNLQGLSSAKSSRPCLFTAPRAQGGSDGIRSHQMIRMRSRNDYASHRAPKGLIENPRSVSDN